MRDVSIMGGNSGWNPREEEMNAADERDEEHTSLASQRHYSVTEIAKMWSLSERTVKRMFQDEPGVQSGAQKNDCINADIGLCVCRTVCLSACIDACVGRATEPR